MYPVRNPDRVKWTDTRWLGAAEVQEVARKMHTAAELSGRCEKPVYHVSLSIDNVDAPTRAQMEAACDAVLRDPGLEEHQPFLVAHNDTAHPHVHMMINRAHPETGRAWSTSHDYRRIEQTLRGLEAEWDLRRVPGTTPASRALTGRGHRGRMPCARRGVRVSVRSLLGCATGWDRTWPGHAAGGSSSRR